MLDGGMASGTIRTVARRSFAALALALLPVLVLVKTGEGPTHQVGLPAAVPVYIDVYHPLNSVVAQDAKEVLQARGLQPEFLTDPGSHARLRVSQVRQVGPSAMPATVRHWGLFAYFWSDVADVPADMLRGQMTGGPVDWREAGSATREMTLYLPAGPREPIESLLESISPPGTSRPALSEGSERVRWLPMADAVRTAAIDRQGLALIPLDQAGPRLKPLSVEGVPAFGSGSSGIAERVWVEYDGAEMAPIARALVDALSVSPPKTTRLLFTGDVIPARCVYARQEARKDYTHAFAATAEVLRGADLTIGSLDAALSDAGKPFGCVQTLNLIAPARSVEGLVFAGYDLVTVAANHAKDCGESPCGGRSLLETIANLRSAGIEAVGGGKDVSEARAPVVLTAGGVRFAFLGYDDIAPYYAAGESTPGTAALDRATLAGDIGAARSAADVVVVLVHWGSEYTPDPTQRQVEVARMAMDAGATLVVGNHPHVVQAVEWRERKPTPEVQGTAFTAYALGNFVFDQDWSLETQQGTVLETEFAGERLVSVRLLPVRIVDMHQPTWATPAEGRSILERVRAATERVGDR